MSLIRFTMIFSLFYSHCILSIFVQVSLLFKDIFVGISFFCCPSQVSFFPFNDFPSVWHTLALKLIPVQGCFCLTLLPSYLLLESPLCQRFAFVWDILAIAFCSALVLVGILFLRKAVFCLMSVRDHSIAKLSPSFSSAGLS